jgi:hypothetical protein
MVLMALADDLATLKAAARSGVLRVRYADGREVLYRSYAELRQAIGDVEQDMAKEASGRPLPVAGFASFRRS